MSWIDDHVARARATLTAKVRALPVAGRILDALAWQVQEVEDVLLDLQMALDPDTATGAQLDRLGKLVGERRQALDDATYRKFILAAAQLLIAKGTVNEVTRLLSTLTGATVRYTTGYPAGYWLAYSVPVALPTSLRARIKARVLEGTPAGVEVQVAELETPGFLLDESTMDGPDGMGILY